MRIIDKYILKNICFSYMFILVVFIGLYFIIDIFSNLSDILRTRPEIKTLLEYYIYSLPLIILRISSFSLLISILYVLGEMNKNNEIISMRTLGLNLAKIAFPVIFFSLCVSISLLFLQENILIHSQKKVQDLKETFSGDSLEKMSEEENLAFVYNNTIFFVEKLLPREKIMQNTIIFRKDKEHNVSEKIIYKRIVFRDGEWIGQNGISYTLNEEGNITGNPQTWEEKKIEMDYSPKELVLKKSIFLQYSSLSTLREEIDRLQKTNSTKLLSNLVIDYHHKLAEPFSGLFLVIGVLPLALEIKKRKVALSSLGAGFIFGFLYYLLSSLSIALGKSGLILPALSAWLAPLFFVSVGITGLILIK
ncbi:MAG: LptF/LptG family permease [Candidatus Omnitrophica bacterium]|nr:LptF/LptG family permease [Candidatus Omnitrophota bacterium]MBD3269826.1 LptF/LptG family permease [Candidatus Omnitrophota bacterium]